MGTTSRIAMHNIVREAAVKRGPQVVEYSGTKYAGYCLQKMDLAKLFEINGYSTDRIAWLKTVRSWRLYFGDYCPRDAVLFNKGAEWTFIVGNLTSREYWNLEEFAKVNKVQPIGITDDNTGLIINDYGGGTLCNL